MNDRDDIRYAESLLNWPKFDVEVKVSHSIDGGKPMMVISAFWPSADGVVNPLAGTLMREGYITVNEDGSFKEFTGVAFEDGEYREWSVDADLAPGWLKHFAFGYGRRLIHEDYRNDREALISRLKSVTDEECRERFWVDFPEVKLDEA